MIIVYISCLTGLYKDFSKIEFTINIPFQTLRVPLVVQLIKMYNSISNAAEVECKCKVCWYWATQAKYQVKKSDRYKCLNFELGILTQRWGPSLACELMFLCMSIATRLYIMFTPKKSNVFQIPKRLMEE